MQITLDQINSVDSEHALYGAITKLTLRAFDNNGTLPMLAVLEVGGLPFALMMIDKVLKRDDANVMKFKELCIKRFKTSSSYAPSLSAYMVASISCENVTLKVKEKHGQLRAFKARNLEIAYQTKIFKELFCECDEKVLTLADIGVE
jgi:hypothetical protein